MKKLFALALIVLVSSCASHPPAVALPPQDVDVSSPHVARIYVLDAPELTKDMHEVRVRADEQPIGALESGDYLCWEREPGACLIEVTFDHIDADHDDVVDLVDANLEAGQVYYYGFTLDPVWSRPKVRYLERDEARALLEHLKPVQR
jgi:hypothetical protein